VSQELLLQLSSANFYCLVDTAENRRLIGKYVESENYPDGRMRFRGAGQALPYFPLYNLGTIDQGACREQAPQPRPAGTAGVPARRELARKRLLPRPIRPMARGFAIEARREPEAQQLRPQHTIEAMHSELLRP